MGMEQYLEIMPLLTDIIIPMSYDESPASRWQFILKGEHSKQLLLSGKCENKEAH